MSNRVAARQKPVGLYVHEPFCKIQKCPYCSFYSVPYNSDIAAEYNIAVKTCLESFLNNNKWRGYTFDTVYFGGGTPSLNADGVCGVMSVLAAYGCPVREATAECNPGTSYETFAYMRKSGINRVSIGVQSFNDDKLRILKRRHNAKTAADTVYAAKTAGFDDISVDFIIGIRGDSQPRDGMFAESKRLLSELPITHVSVYMLSIEKGTPFYKDKTVAADETTMTAEYTRVCESLERLGFVQYEISNFAKANYACKHNLKYWHGEEYLGIGPSAHSLINGRRAHIPPGTANLTSSANFANFAGTIILDGMAEPAVEYVMLGLRLCEGIRFDVLRRLGVYDIFTAELKYIPSDMYEIFYDNDNTDEPSSADTNNVNGAENRQPVRLRLTTKGFLVSNEIIFKLTRKFPN